jgi:hypothetical protein
MATMCRDYGIDLSFDAFISLPQDPQRAEAARMVCAGYSSKSTIVDKGTNQIEYVEKK